MKEPSKLLQMMFETERWQELLDNATEKEIDLKTIKELCYPEERKKLFMLILNDEYNIFPPHIAKIPKDDPGKFREVYVNEARDRILLTLINDCLCELFSDMIHPQCKSYQKGTGTQKVVKEISNEIVKLNKIINGRLGWKADFTKYFDNVKIEVIDGVFDEWENRLGFEKGKEPVINTLRRYYHQDLYFDIKGNLKSRYQGLKQGCAIASVLANVCLYELDEYMSKKYKIYYRYSDDFVVIDDNTNNVIDETNAIISKYGVTLNPKKVEPLYDNENFTFLGFKIKGKDISLSEKRVKKYQNIVESATIELIKRGKPVTLQKATRQLVRLLFEGDYSWGKSCLGTINVKKDLEIMSTFLFDCLRAVIVWEKFHKKKIRLGGLGSVNYLDNQTILRGKGRNVKWLRENTDKYIRGLLSVGCLSNDLKICKEVFNAAVRNMKG